MSNLEKHHIIKKDALSETYYLQSILQEATHLNLLSASELEHIQMQSIEILAKQTERYTGGQSSSIKVETAQELLQSIFYTIGLYLKSLPDADSSVEALKRQPLQNLFHQGKKLIALQLDCAKQLLLEVQNNRILTDNLAYNDTINEGIPPFFTDYDVDFAAHDIPASIDYPLSNDKMDLVGIEYLHCYLQKLFLENQFCHQFAIDDINCLLFGYDSNHQHLLINIFGLALTNAIGCELVGKTALQLNIDQIDRRLLQQKIGNIPKGQLDAMLQDAAIQLCKELAIKDTRLQKHILNSTLNLSPSILNALEKDQLESVFISGKTPTTQSDIQFEDGNKMDDALFRRIAEEIRECRFVSDKIAIIQREIHSFHDLIDILGGDCFFDLEFTMVFQSLGETELALLYKNLPTNLIDINFHATQSEKEWQKRLSCFFEEMEIAKRDRIQSLAEKIDLG